MSSDLTIRVMRFSIINGKKPSKKMADNDKIPRSKLQGILSHNVLGALIPGAEFRGLRALRSNLSLQEVPIHRDDEVLTWSGLDFNNKSKYNCIFKSSQIVAACRY